MPTKDEKDKNEVTIHVDTGGEEKKESPSQGVQQEQPVQQPVVADPLGYAQQREAAATGAATAIPGNLRGIDLMNPVAPSNHPEVDLFNPQPAENAAVAASKEALGKQIATPIPEEKTAFDKGYEEQQGLDAFKALIEEAESSLAPQQEKLAAMEEQDETAQKNERSRKVIAGLGDAISSIVNLIGTTQGAYDQKQVFMEPRLRDVIEQDRQRRYARIEKQRANVQAQINAINNLKLAGAKMDAAARQNAANLAYKAAKDAADRDFKERDSQRKYDLQAQKNANDALFKERDQERKEKDTESAIAARKANTAQGWVRANSYAERNKALNEATRAGGGSGSGRGSGSNNFLNYDDFKDSIARNVVIDGQSFPDWDSLRNSNVWRTADPATRTMLLDIESAKSTGAQEAMRRKYMNHAEAGYGTSAEDEEGDGYDDDITPPSRRAAAQKPADDDNTPPSRRKKQ